MDPDIIPAILPKTCAPELAANLAKLFQNNSIYRSISLHSIISKAMEGVIDSAIKQHLPSNILLSDAQFGFRQGHSAPGLITA
eukprot:g33929.t1